MENRKPIRNFKDLDVYQLAYQSAVLVAKEIIPKLPLKDPFDICDQLGRSAIAVPRLIAEGYAKNIKNLVSKNILTIQMEKVMSVS